mgnify:CR=1 FL=1
MRILDYIPTGHKNAVTRQMLSTLTHLSDRKMRDAISEANAKGGPDELIINLQDGKGYFRPAPNEDNLVRIWRLQEKSRGTSIEASVAAADRYLGRGKKKTAKEASELEKNQISIEDWLDQLAKKP